MKFQELKDELLRRAKEINACERGYRQGLNSSNKSELLKAITDNFQWVFKNKVVDAKLLEENFTPMELWEHGIYTAGRAEARKAKLIFACGSATVEAFGSATVEACGSATVKAYGSATVKACGSATVKAYENSYVENCSQKEILPQSNYAIVKDHYAHKLYLKKGKFEIIEIE
jgi:hypothetical protein